MSRCRQRLTSMEAGVLGRQLTCAEQSKVTPLTGMPGRSMRSSRYVMLATAQTGRFSAKAQAGSLWRRLSLCRAASSAACVGRISFSPSLPSLFSLISFYLSPMCISPISLIPLCTSSDVAFMQGSIVMAEGQPCWLDAPCSTHRKGGVVQGMGTNMPLG